MSSASANEVCAVLESGWISKLTADANGAHMRKLLPDLSGNSLGPNAIALLGAFRRRNIRTSVAKISPSRHHDDMVGFLRDQEQKFGSSHETVDSRKAV